MLAMSGEENVARVGSRGVGRLLNLCVAFFNLSLSSVSRGRDEQERKKGSGGSGACDSVARSGGSVVLVVAR